MSLPERIGRYEILGRLATGGMAEILLGRVRGPSGFERPVVIKRILPHLARTSTFVDMFLDEARIAAGVRHKNVIQVHELARDGEELYIVMEYLEGESAAGLMRRAIQRGEAIPRALAAFVVSEASAGLHAAHELADHDGEDLGVVHRDVSPHNLFVTYDGSVKVLDFGIAKAADRLTVTEAGTIKGKFQYMSPEQTAGLPLDRRHDVFALGIVLFELTTCRALFRRDSQIQAMRAIAACEVPPPSALIDGYPVELERICLRALAKHRDDRYATAAELRRDLVGFLATDLRTALPEESLAALMEDYFAERIEQKRAMLASARRGTRLAEVPSAEAHTEVDVPEVSTSVRAAFEVEITPEEPAPASSPRRGGSTALAWTVAVLALVAAAGVAGATLDADGDPTPSVPVASAERDPVVAAPPAPSAPDVPAAVRVRIETTPPGAEVLRDDEPLGVTPLELSLPRSEEAATLTLRRDGYRPQLHSIVPSRDQLLRIALERQGRRRSPGRGMPEPAATVAEPASGFRRFD